MMKWSSDKVKVTVNKFGVHSRHVIRCFLLHYAVFYLANVDMNTHTSVFLWYLKSQFFPRKHVLMSLGLSYPIYSPATPTRRLLVTFIVYSLPLCIYSIQVACFDAVFDCITNMIGRLFNLHIVKSTPNNQTWKRRDFSIFILQLTSHSTFSYVFIL